MSIKIKGPGGGAPPVEPPGSTAGASPTQPAPETASVAAAGNDVVARVTSGLRAGTLTSEAAVELLIEDTVRRHAGGAKLAAELRQVLRETAHSDPVLAAKIRRLTQAK